MRSTHVAHVLLIAPMIGTILDCYVVLQASTNTLLAHFLSIVFTNFILGVVNKATAKPAGGF